MHIQCEAFTAEDRTEVYVDLGGKTIIRAWGNVAGSGTSSYLGYAILLPLYDARRQLFYCNTNVRFAVEGQHVVLAERV